MFGYKTERKDQKSIQSSTTPDSGYQWESDNFTKNRQSKDKDSTVKKIPEYLSKSSPTGELRWA